MAKECVSWHKIFIFVEAMGDSRTREKVFRFKQFEVKNDISAMKVGTDGVLLGAWCHVDRAKSILDVGTGSGLIALMLAQRFPSSNITAIDISRDAVEEASYNVKNSPWADRINVQHKDFLAMTVKEHGFDAIVSNPPYFIDSLENPDNMRTMARHSSSLDYRHLIEKASQGLLNKGGVLAMISPPEREKDIEESVIWHNMRILKKVMIFTSRKKKIPKRILWEISTNCDSPRKEEYLYLDSDEYRNMTSTFYLDK